MFSKQSLQRLNQLRVTSSAARRSVIGTTSSFNSMPIRQFSSQNDGDEKKSGSSFYKFGAFAALSGGIATALYFNSASKNENSVVSSGPAVAYAATPDGFREVEISFAETLGEGEMQALKIGEANDQKVLVARYQGKLYSTGNFCSHFGVPLNGGMLFDDKVLCPAHAAGFSIITGEPDRAPGLDGIPSFAVVEREGKFFVQVPAEGLPKKKTQALSKRDPENKTHFVIVGGGPAGLNCAETLRQSNFTGQITVISREDVIPYDRTLLTKAVGGDSSKWSLRPADFLADADIDYKLKSRVYSVNPKEKKVILVNGEHIHYDKLCIATGANVWKPPVDGLDAKNVFFMRTNKDQTAIKEAAKTAKNIVVIGASFIGSETAAGFVTQFKEAKVTLVSATDVPFKLQFGEEIGKMMKSEHEKAGVNVETSAMLEKVNANADGSVKSVSLSNGNEIEADLVLLGTGVRPATEFLKDSGLELEKDGGVTVDPFLQTNDKHIFAAGDIASYPYWPTGSHTRTEHWVVALDQGTFAAFNMLGKLVPYGSIPFFWTRHYNKSLQYVGNGQGWTDIHIDGDVAANKFIAYYSNKNDQVIAVAGQGNSSGVLTLFEALHQNVMPKASEIKSGRETVESIKSRVKQNSGASRCKRANCCQKKNVL